MNSQPHRWQVLTAGICSLIVVLGMARFAYTPLLPLMQRYAGLGVAQAGWLASLNYLGYLGGAWVASLITDWKLKDRLYRASLIVAIITTCMMGLTDNMMIWALSRFLAGLASAAGMLFGAGLIMNWLIRHDHRSELGIHFAGVGLGIAGSSGAVMLMNRWGVDLHVQWYALAAMGCLLLVPALGWLPAPRNPTMARSGQTMRDNPPSPMFLRLFMGAYFCAGVGYVISATFIVAIIDHLPGLAGHGTLTFLVIGLAAAPACLLCDLVARLIGHLNALIVAAALQIAGILLPVLTTGLLSILCGAALFGATFMGVVSVVLSMAARYYPTRPAKMMGKMTLSYGVAQIIAPALTGTLAIHFGGYQAGLYLAAATMAAGTILFGLLRIIEIRTTVVVEAEVLQS